MRAPARSAVRTPAALTLPQAALALLEGRRCDAALARRAGLADAAALSAALERDQIGRAHV